MEYFWTFLKKEKTLNNLTFSSDMYTVWKFRNLPQLTFFRENNENLASVEISKILSHAFLTKISWK